MTPLYFPFTTISKGMIDRMTAVFGPVAVLGVLPEHTRTDSGLKTIIPGAGHVERLRHFLKEYRECAAYSRDRLSHFVQGTGEKPFYDPDWAAQIRSDVMKSVDKDPIAQPSSANEQDMLLRAMAFLEIAREYDEAARNIDREFHEIERREKLLLSELKCEEDLEAFSFDNTEDDDISDQDESIRLPYRIKAWAELFLSAWPEIEKNEGVIFLTDNPEVTGCFDECGTGLVPVDVPAFAPHDPVMFKKAMKLLVTSEYPACLPEIRDILCKESKPSGTGFLSLWIAPDTHPQDFFITLSKGRQPEIRRYTELRNTVIGLFRP